MNEVEVLAKQTEEAYAWTNTLLHSIPYETWDQIPSVVDTSVTWQAGHLIMSIFFHSIITITGHPAGVHQQVPLRDYAALFTSAPPQQSLGKTKPETLQTQLQLVEQTSLRVINGLTPDDLQRPLEPTQVPHPIAKTKFEALNWNISHTMWHCGQLGLLKRIVHERFDFGLKLPD
ncbi:DinB superfamily protein [Catalinimonas alkaloidigena]|uniref:DinB superfamily protein n=1 Tax=Catalinimonas alkaloidigena TaxID=1075417 RepID=A0A1G8XBL8_9BACT|nr:DinB family protein [Catalinimonas alkaloidigena]SDJ87871.1 DinB superfamily protein [Catalinimonas alkaloidigena]